MATPPAEGVTPKADAPALDPKADVALLNQDAPKAEEPKAAAPDKYEFKAPEGMELNPELIGKASEMFKEMGLSQDHAQKLVDFYSEQVKSVAEQPYRLYQNTREGWRAEVQKDPEIGGQKLDAVRSTVGKAIDSLPGELGKQFRDAMNVTGAGDHPAFVKAMYHWAKLVTEGTQVPGTKPPGQGAPSGPAAAMYPNLPSAGR